MVNKKPVKEVAVSQQPLPSPAVIPKGNSAIAAAIMALNDRLAIIENSLHGKNEEEQEPEFTASDEALVKAFIQRKFEETLINLINTQPELLKRLGYGNDSGNTRPA